MKMLLRKREVHYLAIALVTGFATYAFFINVPDTNAEIISSVGSASVILIPNPSTSGTESFHLQYTGVGQLDLTGWSLHNSEGLLYSFPTLLIANGQSVKVCSDSSKGVGCDYEWSGGDAWSNTADSMTVMDNDEKVIASLSYPSTSVGGEFRTKGEIIETILTGKDTIMVCHSGNGVKYTNPNSQIKGVVDGKGHGNHIDNDVIPPFFYNIGSGTKYYSGINWESGADTYATECGG